jgi:hypothetical protein
MGDSTARRAGMTMNEMFNFDSDSDSSTSSSPHVEYKKLENISMLTYPETCNLLDKEKFGSFGFPSVCRRIPGGGSGMFLLISPLFCTKHIMFFFEKELQLFKDYYSSSPSSSNPPSSASTRSIPITKNVDVIIISVGPWEVRKPTVCLLKGYNYTVQDWIDMTIDAIESFQRHTNITILWKTSGFIQGKSYSRGNEKFRMMNTRVMNRIDALRAANTTTTTSNETVVTAAAAAAADGASGVFTYLNWGAAVEPRSFGEARNVGDDHVAHYGLETRLVLLQMMTNYLLDLGFFQNSSSSTSSSSTNSDFT